MSYLPIKTDNLLGVPLLHRGYGFEESPLTVLAKTDPAGTIGLIDRLSARDLRKTETLARANSMSDIVRSHCATIAAAAQSRPDKDHFRVTTVDSEGHTGVFFGRFEDRFRKVTTQLDMW